MGLIISPYYNYYVIRAMAEMGHREQALKWIRQYWGGMVDEGATSFWEAYDPSWYHEDFHSSLQSDNRSGYFVSLAHGWSSGPTAWLMEQVLGIQPTGAGFATVDHSAGPGGSGVGEGRGADAAWADESGCEEEGKRDGDCGGCAGGCSGAIVGAGFRHECDSGAREWKE